MEEILEKMEIMRADMITMHDEMTKLRVEVKDVRDALILESNETTRHIKDIFQRLTETSELVFPMLRRVFPEITIAQRNAAEWMKRLPKED